jgi:hypothetical protein
MKYGFKNKFGFSFSWKRLLGISGLKNHIARKIGIPTTKYGRERKLGALIIKWIFGNKKK